MHLISEYNTNYDTMKRIKSEDLYRLSNDPVTVSFSARIKRNNVDRYRKEKNKNLLLHFTTNENQIYRISIRISFSFPLSYPPVLLCSLSLSLSFAFLRPMIAWNNF